MSNVNKALRLYRNLLREISLADGQAGRQTSPAAANFVRRQFRKHQTTDQQHCKAREEMFHLGDAYETYLRSQRTWLAFHQEYHAKGERSVADTAQIVGFKLPHDPK